MGLVVVGQGKASILLDQLAQRARKANVVAAIVGHQGHGKQGPAGPDRALGLLSFAGG